MLNCQFSVTVAQRFGELLRKLWNPRNFKAHVSPHEMLQVCAVLLYCIRKYHCGVLKRVVQPQLLLVISMTNNEMGHFYASLLDHIHQGKIYRDLLCRVDRPPFGAVFRSRGSLLRHFRCARYQFL